MSDPINALPAEWPYPTNYGKENEFSCDVLVLGGGNLWRGKDGLAHGPSPRNTIGTTIFPEPNPIQDAPYNLTRTIGEEFMVGSEAGAIAYWGCVNTGERTAQPLALEFFSAYTPGTTLASMWHHAVEAYYTLSALSRYDREFDGDAGNMWEFHTPERFPLFGDPSLRVGGVSPPETDGIPPALPRGCWWASGYHRGRSQPGAG